MSVKFHTKDGRVYRLYLRGRLTSIRSEKKLREVVESSIKNYEENKLCAWRMYGRKLREKWEDGKEFEVFGILGIISQKKKLEK